MYVYRAYFKANLMQRIINNYLVKNSKFCIHDTTLFKRNIISDEKLMVSNELYLILLKYWRLETYSIDMYIFLIRNNMHYAALYNL